MEGTVDYLRDNGNSDLWYANRWVSSSARSSGGKTVVCLADRDHRIGDLKMSNKMTMAIGALALCAGGAVAGPASFDQVDRSDYQIYSGSSQSMRGGLSSLYSDLETGADGFVSFPDTAIEADSELEVAGIADYNSIAAGSIALDQFVFVGGVDQANGVVFFDFFDTSGTLIDGFGVALAEAGSFIWTIDLAETMMIDAAGLIRMSIDDEGLAGTGSMAAGRWFLGNNGATIGDAGSAEADPDFNFAFALNSSVPTPSSLALLGLGGLGAVRRRR